MTASPEARFAPIGLLRGGLLLIVVGALLAWAPMGPVPTWLSMTVLVVGVLATALALGIRMLGS